MLPRAVPVARPREKQARKKDPALAKEPERVVTVVGDAGADG